MTKEEAVIILDGFKNNPLFSDTHAQALDMAISALSADGEYIKKEDILNELGDTNMDILTDEVKEIVNGLPSYSFPDSAEDNTMEWLENEDGSYECSKCHMTRSGLISGDFNFCPNCGRKAVQK